MIQVFTIINLYSIFSAFCFYCIILFYCLFSGKEIAGWSSCCWWRSQPDTCIMVDSYYSNSSINSLVTNLQITNSLSHSILLPIEIHLPRRLRFLFTIVSVPSYRTRVIRCWTNLRPLRQRVCCHSDNLTVSSVETIPERIIAMSPEVNWSQDPMPKKQIPQLVKTRDESSL